MTFKEAAAELGLGAKPSLEDVQKAYKQAARIWCGTPGPAPNP